MQIWIDIRNATTCFLLWKPNFDPVEIMNSSRSLTPISVVLSRIPSKEYMVVLLSIATRINTFLPPHEEATDVKIIGFPSIHILVPCIEILPTHVLSPSISRNSM